MSATYLASSQTAARTASSSTDSIDGHTRQDDDLPVAESAHELPSAPPTYGVDERSNNGVPGVVAGPRSPGHRQCRRSGAWTRPDPWQRPRPGVTSTSSPSPAVDQHSNKPLTSAQTLRAAPCGDGGCGFGGGVAGGAFGPGGITGHQVVALLRRRVDTHPCLSRAPCRPPEVPPDRARFAAHPAARLSQR